MWKMLRKGAKSRNSDRTKQLSTTLYLNSDIVIHLKRGRVALVLVQLKYYSPAESVRERKSTLKLNLLIASCATDSYTAYRVSSVPKTSPPPPPPPSPPFFSPHPLHRKWPIKISSSFCLFLPCFRVKIEMACRIMCALNLTDWRFCIYKSNDW